MLGLLSVFDWRWIVGLLLLLLELQLVWVCLLLWCEVWWGCLWACAVGTGVFVATGSWCCCVGRVWGVGCVGVAVAVGAGVSVAAGSGVAVAVGVAVSVADGVWGVVGVR